MFFFLCITAETPTLYEEVPITTGWIGNLIDSSVRFCVALFIMINGALLLGKEMNTIEFRAIALKFMVSILNRDIM